MPSEYIPVSVTRLVIDRARACCEYCRSQSKFSTQSFSVEHISPPYIGGLTVESNLALACQGCNSHKGIKIAARDPAPGVPAPVFNPREENWSDHFTWTGDYTIVQGTTPTGRATVAALRLNREGLVNVRRVLYAMGKHPPAEPRPARRMSENVMPEKLKRP